MDSSDDPLLLSIVGLLRSGEYAGCALIGCMLPVASPRLQLANDPSGCRRPGGPRSPALPCIASRTVLGLRVRVFAEPAHGFARQFIQPRITVFQLGEQFSRMRRVQNF